MRTVPILLSILILILILTSGCVQECEYPLYWSAVLPYFRQMSPPDFLLGVAPGNLTSEQIDAEQLEDAIKKWEKLHENLVKIEIAKGCQDMHEYWIDSVGMMVDAYKALRDADIALFEQTELEAMDPLNLWFEQVNALQESRTE